MNTNSALKCSSFEAGGFLLVLVVLFLTVRIFRVFCFLALVLLGGI